MAYFPNGTLVPGTDVNDKTIQTYDGVGTTDRLMMGSNRTADGLAPGALQYMSDSEQAAYFKGLDKPYSSMDSPGLGGLGTVGDWETGLGIGKLGLGVLEYMDASKTAGLQRDVLKQQIANNQYNMDQTKASHEVMKKFSESGGVFGRTTPKPATGIKPSGL